MAMAGTSPRRPETGKPRNDRSFGHHGVALMPTAVIAWITPMKRILTGFLAAALTAPAVLSAASFEGKVSFKMSPAKGQPQEIAYSIKGDKLRIEIPSQAASGLGGMIYDPAKHEMTIVMDAQQMYMVQAVPTSDAGSNGDKAGSQGSLEKSGEKEKILGYDTQKYVSTAADGTKSELWLAEGLGTFMMPGAGGPMGGRGMRGGRGGAGAGGNEGWARALAGKDLFPLRVITHGKDGDFRMEATAIEKQALPDSLFSPPAGYQKFDMANMMKGMMPGGMRP
jgi:hypothetical protein